MSYDPTVDVDNFAAALDDLLSDVEGDVESALPGAIKKTARDGLKAVKKAAKANWGEGETGQRYVRGFSSHVEGDGTHVSAEIGNREVPGLVHLLEKGHNTPAGRRIAGKEHLAPAFDDMSVELVEKVNEAVGTALEG